MAVVTVELQGPDCEVCKEQKARWFGSDKEGNQRCWCDKHKPILPYVGPDPMPVKHAKGGWIAWPTYGHQWIWPSYGYDAPCAKCGKPSECNALLFDKRDDAGHPVADFACADCAATSTIRGRI